VIVPESLEEFTKAGACLRYARTDVCVGIGIGGKYAAEVAKVDHGLQGNITGLDNRR